MTESVYVLVELEEFSYRVRGVTTSLERAREWRNGEPGSPNEYLGPFDPNTPLEEL